MPIIAQQAENDTTLQQNNIGFDTVTIVNGDDDLTAPIHYKANDSIVYDIQNMMLYLYGDADMDYDKIELESEIIRYNWNTSSLSAEGRRDSITGELVGTPIFKESGGEYASKKMEYNFRTSKGRTFDVVTQFDEAYIHSEVIKKNEENEWYGLHTKFTTCEHVDHPHFYIEAKKSKVVPDKVMVTGPANLVIGGINTPLVLPFAIFPLKKGKRSGLIFPKYEVIPVTGEFRFLNGGYYWAVNEKLGMQFTSDISTRGRFRIGTDIQYKSRYRFSGNFKFDYNYTPPTDKLQSLEGRANDFNIIWNHRMNPKASQRHDFNARINARTVNYTSNTRETQADQVLTTALNSNLTYRRKFQGKPYNISVSAGHSQNLSTHAISLTLPELTFNLRRISPFQRKIKTEKKPFYENIGFSYNFDAKAKINTVDSLLFKKESLDDIRYGVRQRVVVDAPFDLFKYFKLTPRFNYTERWYFKEENRIGMLDTLITTSDNGKVDTTISRFMSDTLSGFLPVRNFGFTTTLSTAMTGIYNFKGKRLKAIRHVIKPSLTYTYAPDFGAERWGYYDTYYDEIADENIEYNRHNINSSLYGVPGSSLQNALTFNLVNNIDMKVLNKKDTSNLYKKVPLIENIRISGGYNFGAETMKVDDLNININSSLFKKIITWRYSINMSAYARDSTNKRINTTVWQANKRLLEWDNMSFYVGLNFTGKKKNKEQSVTKGTIEERDYVLRNPNSFYDFNIPWSLSIDYNLNLTNGHIDNVDSLILRTNSLRLGGSINITPNWKINASSGYDIRNKDFTYTRISAVRSLHCWVLSFNWTAYPISRQQFDIELRVLSGLLQELKLSRKQPVDSRFTTF